LPREASAGKAASEDRDVVMIGIAGVLHRTDILD
jgi:hypothetical protein